MVKLNFVENNACNLILATKVSIERKDILTTDEFNKLQGLYTQMLGPAIEIYQQDKDQRGRSRVLVIRRRFIILF